MRKVRHEHSICAAQLQQQLAIGPGCLAALASCASLFRDHARAVGTLRVAFAAESRNYLRASLPASAFDGGVLLSPASAGLSGG